MLTADEDMPRGLALYLRSRHSIPYDQHAIEVEAAAFASRARAMRLGWMAIGAFWQDAPDVTRTLNTPEACAAYRKALRDVGIIPYVWGYPCLGGESEFVQRMVDAAGDDGLILLDPELAMNPKRSLDMTGPNASAQTIVRELRAAGARRIGLSTFGGVPRWFPLRAFLGAGIDFAGGQSYTDDSLVAGELASFASEIAGYGPGCSLVPNFGCFAKADGGSRSKTPDELRAHLAAFGPQRAMIGWAENFVTASLEHVLAGYVSA